MRRRLPIISLLAALAAYSLAAQAAAAPVFPTGLRVGLETPPGLVVSHRIPGFEDSGRKVLVAIFELPGQAYDVLKKEGFDTRTKGMTDVSKAPFPVAGGSGYLISGEGKVKDHGEHRWLLMARPDAGKSAAGTPMTALVRVDVPDDARAVYSDAVVRKMLASIAFRPTPTKELLSLLPFNLTDLAGFRVAHILPGGAILTDGPNDTFAGNKQPYLIVSVSGGGPTDPDLRSKFAGDLLRSAPLNDLQVTSAEKIRIDQMPAFELRATAKDPTGQAVTVVQWLRFGTNGYMRIIGVAPKESWDKDFSRFRKIRDGIAAR
ncbi:MAG TPA: hypothetical protein VE224_20370 [Pseudolabrys sp.]|jgi:hypothetical protein|nr:hypothetical protein [Pseudolabrys sp.]